jgi:hypothetical protein
LTGNAPIEINLGHIPFDVYTGPAAAVYGSHCLAGQTVQQCMQNALHSYSQAGVTGVRFFFGLCGDASSTPIPDCYDRNLSTPDQNPAPPLPAVALSAITGPPTVSGTISSQWATNVDLFMQDLATYGITHVTATPGLDATVVDWGRVVTGLPDSCGDTTTELYFSPALPFGKTVIGDQTSGWVIGTAQSDEHAYTCSPYNPIFIGWQPIYNAINTVLSKAAAHGIKVTELDVQNESDFDDYTAFGRLIYDPMPEDVRPGDVSNASDVLESLRYYMGQYTGWDRSAVTYSVNENYSSQAEYSCTNEYGDPARVNHLSHLMAAIAGNPFFGPFGPNNWGSLTNLLPCGGTLSSVSLPVSNTSPTVIDIHSKPSLALAVQGGNGAVYGEAKQEYNDLKSYLDSFGPSGWHGYNPQIANALVVFGESHTNVARGTGPYACTVSAPNPNVWADQPPLPGLPCPSWNPNCPNNTYSQNSGDPATAAADQIQGFNDSYLNSNHGGPGAVFRPWANAWHYDSCYPFPAPLGPYRH